jgi:2-polyprenyl-3-methyl-5-hydroxy-6-metoxy-1,4-benzoquinol methylase
MTEEPDFWKALYANRNDERVVEYPYVFRRLRPLNPHTMKVLDVGCLDSRLAEALFQMGYEVTGIDIREYPDKHSFKFVKDDIRKTDFSPDFFDQITCISTIEHVGLNAYGNKGLEPNGDLTAMIEIHRILRPNGNLIVTVPFGCHKNDYWIRYYNRETVRALTRPFTVLEAVFYKKHINVSPSVWTECSIGDAAKMGIGSGAVPLAVCCMTLTK